MTHMCALKRGPQEDMNRWTINSALIIIFWSSEEIPTFLGLYTSLVRVLVYTLFLDA